MKDKRKSFPRFYFLSDEDLLEMIGQTKKASVVQAHLKKLFSGIQNVHFNSSGNIIAVESPQNEIVNLNKPVQVTNEIEVFCDWCSRQNFRKNIFLFIFHAFVYVRLKQLVVDYLKNNYYYLNKRT